MRYATRSLPLLVCIGLTACGAAGKTSQNGVDDHVSDSGVNDEPDAGHGSPPRPPRDVYLSPTDISTAVHTSPLELWVDGIQGDLGDEKLGELASAASLVTWPELTSIAFDVTAIDASKAGDGRAHVTLAPADRLENRWYALVVTSLPTGFEWGNAPGSREQRLARFRIDSMPVIASVTRCNKGGLRLSVHFSEPVTSADAQKVAVEGAACEPLVGGAQTVDSIDLNCSADQGASSFSLSFGQTPAQHADEDSWLDRGDGCFEFVPDQVFG